MFDRKFLTVVSLSTAALITVTVIFVSVFGSGAEGTLGKTAVVSADHVSADTHSRITYDASHPDIRDRADAENAIRDYATTHGVDLNAYPSELIGLLANNPETYSFVINYPRYYGVNTVTDISPDLECGTVPLYLQWDERWGYREYGSNMMAFTGCGPTCLSMVASYLLQDPSLDPYYVASYAMENGYYDYEYGSGTLWTLMSEGASGLGLVSEEVPLDEACIVEQLRAGHPVIMSMGPGVFTSEGHFIVLVSCDNNGHYTINDPNSIERSERTWEYEDFADQVQGIWAIHRQ